MDTETSRATHTAVQRDLSQQEIVLLTSDSPNCDLPKDDIRSKHNDACLSIENIEDGYNAGRPYLVRFANEKESDEWIHDIFKAKKEALALAVGSCTL